MRLAAAVALAALLAPLSALAQPAPAPAPEPAPPPAPEPAPAPPSQAAAVDPADVRDAYDRAFAALVRGDWATAIALFDDVAARSVEIEARRRGAGEAGQLAGGAAPARLDLDEEDRTSGRASFVVSTTVAAFYAGLVIDDLLGVDSYEGSVGVVTGATAAGLTASLLATRGRHISEGTAAAYSVGIVMGAANGLLFAPVLGIDPEPDCVDLEVCGDGEINQTYLTFGLGAMVAGGIGGALLGDRFEPTAPQSRFVDLMAIHGVATTGALVVFTDGFGVDDGDVGAAIFGAGLDVGLAAGIALAPRIDWSASRMTYVALGDAVGALGGFALAAVAGGDEYLYAGAIVGGMWAGFGTSIYLTRGMTPHRRYAPAPPTASVGPITGSHGMRGIGILGAF